MELTTLQKRIEERAEQNLLQDLKTSFDEEVQIQYKLGQDNFQTQLKVISRYRSSYESSYRTEIYECGNDFTKELFKKLYPGYVAKVTDEILRKIDEIDYLVNTQKQEDI